MRVLTVGNVYPPHHFGGYEQVWASAVDHLRTRGHVVEVLATDYRHPGGDDGAEPAGAGAGRWAPSATTSGSITVAAPINGCVCSRRAATARRRRESRR